MAPDAPPTLAIRPVPAAEERSAGRVALAVEVEVARGALLKPETVVIRRVLEEVRRLLQHVLAFGNGWSWLLLDVIFGRLLIEVVGGRRRVMRLGRRRNGRCGPRLIG